MSGLIKITLLFFVLIIFACCNTKNVFNGEFRQVHLKNGIIELHETLVNVEELNSTDMLVVDTFMVMLSEHYDDKFLSIYNLNDLTFYGRFVSQGRGPNECLYLTIYPENQDDSTKIWMFDSPDIKVLDITNSVKQQTAVISKNIKFSKSRLAHGVSSWYRINDSLIVGKEVLYASPKENIRIIKYNLNQDTILEEFKMYNNLFFNDYSLFFGTLGVKKDGSRIVNSMLFFNQLNFYDFEEQRGFSVSTDPEPVGITEIPPVKGQNVLSYNIRNHYYVRLRITDDLIFVSYCRDKDHEMQKCSEIHVFNWDGDFLYILKPEEKFGMYEIDEKNRRLYLYRKDEKLYAVDIKEIFQ